MSYATELLKKQFQGNIVVQIYGEYFAIRQPDSGLVIPAGQANLVRSLRINPTSADLRRVNTTVGQYSFQIVDKDNTFTAFLANNDTLTGAAVRIWIGRNTAAIDGASFPFSQYFELPQTIIKKIEHKDTTYVFTTAEQTDRMGRPVFNTQTTVGAAIDLIATVFQASGDITKFRSSGYLKIGNELVSYSSKDDTLKRFNGVIRGEDGTPVEEHKLGDAIFEVYKVTDNPINIFLKFLISNGGGGPYDVYPEGLGISASLIDVTGLENLRDNIFLTDQFRLYMYGIANGLTYLENEIMFANNVRVAISSDSKITLALLDQSIFGAEIPIIDESTIIDYPSWSVDDNTVINQVIFEWDWNEGTGKYNERSVFEDAASIATYGLRQALKIPAKGIVAALSGAAMVNDRSFRLLTRFANPNPQISVTTQIDKSLVNIGDKVRVESSQIPTQFGSLEFNQEVEVVSRSIDEMEGKCTFQLVFTSYSGIRSCYIAPSDVILTFVDQKTVNVASGRGAQYKPGWIMKLWDIDAGTHTADAPNVIDTIVGDQITFVSNFTTTLVDAEFRIVFADYDEVVEDQHRYGFVSPAPSHEFPDGSASYLITF